MGRREECASERGRGGDVDQVRGTTLSLASVASVMYIHTYIIYYHVICQNSPYISVPRMDPISYPTTVAHGSSRLGMDKGTCT